MDKTRINPLGQSVARFVCDEWVPTVRIARSCHPGLASSQGCARSKMNGANGLAPAG